MYTADRRGRAYEHTSGSKLVWCVCVCVCVCVTQITVNPKIPIPDEVKAHAAGFAEAFFSADEIYNYWDNYRCAIAGACVCVCVCVCENTAVCTITGTSTGMLFPCHTPVFQAVKLSVCMSTAFSEMHGY